MNKENIQASFYVLALLIFVWETVIGMNFCTTNDVSILPLIIGQTVMAYPYAITYTYFSKRIINE